MTTTTSAAGNSRARKTLASQIDRLDAVLDGLADGLNEAVADAVKNAVGLAVREAVQAAPQLPPAALSPEMSREPPPALPRPKPPRPGARERLGSLWRGVRAGLAGLGLACAARWAQARAWAGRALAGLAARCRTAGKYRREILTALGVGAGVAAAAWFAGPWLAAALSGVGGFVTALAVQGWLWLRKALALEPARAT
jgi:hypothetical protein